VWLCIRCDGDESLDVESRRPSPASGHGRQLDRIQIVVVARAVGFHRIEGELSFQTSYCLHRNRFPRLGHHHFARRLGQLFKAQQAAWRGKWHARL